MNYPPPSQSPPSLKCLAQTRLQAGVSTGFLVQSESSSYLFRIQIFPSLLEVCTLPPNQKNVCRIRSQRRGGGLKTPVIVSLFPLKVWDPRRHPEFLSGKGSLSRRRNLKDLHRGINIRLPVRGRVAQTAQQSVGDPGLQLFPALPSSSRGPRLLLPSPRRVA